MVDEKADTIDPSRFDGIGEAPLWEFVLDDEESTRRLGRELAARLEGGDFVGLIGDLGAGKTMVVQGIVDELDREGRWNATSPTYALIQVYETTPPVYHLDLYRLEGWGDLESIGYWDVVEGPDGVVCVEWLDRIPGAWPQRGMIIELVRRPAKRIAKIWGDPSWRRKLEGFAGFGKRKLDDQR